MALSLKSVACAVLGAVIILIAATTGSAVAHELQHATHHTAGMHGSGLCAWMCATTAADTAGPAHHFQIFAILEQLSMLTDLAASDQIFTSSAPRAPPVSR
ncbi:MAG: hypothetical protein KF814_09500 [Nitrospiraceae bacterium]|nr:hypothetical protein [Nitrospiraceae bacterium]